MQIAEEVQDSVSAYALENAWEHRSSETGSNGWSERCIGDIAYVSTGHRRSSSLSGRQRKTFRTMNVRHALLSYGGKVRFFVIELMCAVLRLYKRFISPVLPPACRFSPSCSEYAQAALRRHGIMYGSALALWRLCRCQPFSRGGYDPVP
jgi:putative membrane protein insertion efficiency factor